MSATGDPMGGSGARDEHAPTIAPHGLASWLLWCHNCESWFFGSDLEVKPMRWAAGALEWACPRCDDEPLGLGVWRMVCPEHLTPRTRSLAGSSQHPDWEVSCECER